MPNEALFAYGVGRIRAIEKRLLDRSKLEKMIDSKTPEDALKILIDAGYGESSGGISYSRANGYERLLREERKKLYRLLSELTEKSDALNVFLLNNDYHNIKVLLKAEFLGINADDLLLEPATIPVENMKMIIRDRSFKQMPGYMSQAIEESIDIFNRTRDPQQIDLILDRAYFRHIVELANNAGLDFIKEFVVTSIDLTNIKTFIRLKRLNMPVDFLKKNLIQGGKIDINTFIDSAGKPLEAFIETMKKTSYEKIFTKDGNVSQDINIASFEKRTDDYIMAMIKKGKYKTFGIEPLIGYLLAKETEFKNIRIIMVGKINNITSDIIRERLRETYV